MSMRVMAPTCNVRSAHHPSPSFLSAALITELCNFRLSQQTLNTSSSKP